MSFDRFSRRLLRFMREYSCLPIPRLRDADHHDNSIPLGEAIKYEYAWLVFAIINVVTLLPMFVLRIKGSEWRACAWQKPPTFHNDI